MSSRQLLSSPSISRKVFVQVAVFGVLSTGCPPHTLSPFGGRLLRCVMARMGGPSFFRAVHFRKGVGISYEVPFLHFGTGHSFAGLEGVPSGSVASHPYPLGQDNDCGLHQSQGLGEFDAPRFLGGFHFIAG